MNESSIRTNIKTFGVFYLLRLVVITPFYEELIFRLNFKNLFKNKYIYAIITGILFGFIHVISYDKIQILYLIPYSLSGFMLGYMYKDSNNIFASIYIHLINNLITLLLFLGGLAI